MLHSFSYVAPKDLPELYQLLKTHGKKARILAGGTDLLVDISQGSARPELVIDVKKIPEFRKMAFSSREGLSIGATVTCIELMTDPTVRKSFPLLVDAAGRIGSPQLRNRATIAGNLCTASPCADMGASLLALGASVELGSAVGKRTIPLKEFFAGVKKTQRQENEVVERIIVPAEMAGAAFGMEKLKRIKGHDLAVVSVAMAKKGNVMRFGIGSAAPTPIVLKDFPVKTPVKDVCTEALKRITPIDDIRASREYRIFMVQAMIEKLMKDVK